MTAAPLELPPGWPRGPLTVAQYLELGETEYRTELAEGQLLMSPSPVPDHCYAMGEIFVALRAALPPDYEGIQEIDLDLELVSAREPGTVRRPDLVVLKAGARLRVREHGGLLRASDALLVVEIVSSASIRTDRIVKRAEYADAGVPPYWIVDLAEPVSIVAGHQAGELGYADGGDITGTFRTTVPFAFELDLTTLV
jgi:Uma2 family endonuclease